MVRRPLAVGGSAFTAVVVLVTSAAPAIPPSELRHYSFDPAQSTLLIEGGFAGLYHQLTIDGTFNLALDWGMDFPELTVDAYFVDVNASASSPHLTWGPIDLDQALNLTGLDGEVDNFGFTTIHFTGVEGQGQPIEVAVTAVDGGVHLTGQSSPSCCDMFRYEIDAFARLGIPSADLNHDGVVDLADYDLLSANYGAGPSIMPTTGDTDGDGDVDLRDFVHLAMAFDAPAETPPDAIPEPATIALLGFAFLVVARRRR